LRSKFASVRVGRGQKARNEIANPSGRLLRAKIASVKVGRGQKARNEIANPGGRLLRAKIASVSERKRWGWGPNAIEK
jgi:hypothetical protein